MGNTLQDKTVVVVGSGSGIARAVALLAQSEGARVVVAGRHQGKLASAYRGSDIERRNLQLSFDTKVIGPTMLAKYFARLFNPGGPLVVFSGVHAFKLNVGYLGVGITNGAVDFLTRRLAVELAPIRVNAISPGVIDTGAWDSLGDEGSGITSSTSPPATRRDGSGPLRMW